MKIDRQEAERLVNTYSNLILRLSYTYLRSTQDAEDVCQTVFLKLLTGAERFDSREHEKAWVVRTAINACKDELRAFRAKPCPPAFQGEDPAFRTQTEKPPPLFDILTDHKHPPARRRLSRSQERDDR